MTQVESVGQLRGERLDRIGVITSCACAVHCALMPTLVGFLPLIGLSAMADERIELALIGIACVVGIGSLLPSFLGHHRRKLPLLIFGGGIMSVVAGHGLLNQSVLLETTAIVAGGLLMMTAHILNRRLCKICCAAQCR